VQADGTEVALIQGHRPYCNHPARGCGILETLTRRNPCPRAFQKEASSVPLSPYDRLMDELSPEAKKGMVDERGLLDLCGSIQIFNHCGGCRMQPTLARAATASARAHTCFPPPAKRLLSSPALQPPQSAHASAMSPPVLTRFNLFPPRYSRPLICRPAVLIHPAGRRWYVSMRAYS
jgi:hypothetical protein